jgi:hypothetical protein
MPELTKRDVLKALGAAGITVGGAGVALEWTDNDTVEDHDRQTLYAVAKTVYPSDLDGIEAFVDGYMSGRIDADTERAEEIAAAIDALDEYTRSWEDTTFRELDPEPRDETLRGMGVATATPDPDGHPHERVRYYLVNELLFGLYSSPTGGELVGIENPQGHPGGTTSYHQPPE